ncbi:class I SAM-dependent methyltransferase [Pseudoalteromonas gelatinilytica]|uniref:Methyltransferase type 11 domain-containing protein n=1 Tax=Pseudoalteromonas gelatinilytica TaxID=1703256 RepID=A0ABQ1UCZ4_9GAMM|nr:class I SAM-dependent methyltransferase [Pseudoalteromonas profundi]GGF15667.1 hypothetical protein GCM10008027_45520 [Pseudoalteromonas profundi]
MSDHWTNYWQQGHLTSFGNGFKNNYKGSLQQFWYRFADKLEENSAVLDVGTGNGALIQLIQKDKQLNCFGIDQAKVHPEVSKSIGGTFLSNTAAENLPFNDGEFSCVVAQFSLEYSLINKSIEEVFRVLKGEGVFAFVCHHPESIIVKPNTLILAAANFVKKNTTSTLTVLVSCLDKKELDSIEGYFDEIETEIKNNFKHGSDAMLGTNLPAFLSFLRKNKNNNIDFRKALSLFLNELDLLILRLTELVNAADQSATLLKKVKAISMSYEEGTIFDNQYDGLLATYIIGKPVP